MKLGNFSISLNVKDIKASLAFYESLGFTIYHGDIEQKWLILKNETSTIGLFQDMFDKNILTYNPGWDSHAKPLEDFTDIREIQQTLKAKGIKLVQEVEQGTTGPGRLSLLDPDGNPILIDQHV